MRQLIFILLLISNFSFAQSKEKILNDFMLGDELKSENILVYFNQFDFSGLWSHTESHRIYGIKGTDHQRIKIKLTSIEKSKANPNEYLVSGKSNIQGNITDFIGKIKLNEIREAKELHFGVDNEYKDKGISSEGILIADYEFKENPNQKNTGIFRGILYSKWYLDSTNQIKYDDIQSISDGYMNNAFIGTWTSYSKDREKICNWADFRVPNANQDFDIGAAEFSPSKKYYSKGWENYQNAWVEGNKEAIKEELKEW